MVLLVESQGGKANAPVSLELTDVQRCKYLAILIDSQKHVDHRPSIPCCDQSN